MNMSIPRDVQEFLDEYPDIVDDPTSRANLDFYSNNLRCQPDDRTIEEIHERYLHIFIFIFLLRKFPPPARASRCYFTN